LLSLLMLN